MQGFGGTGCTTLWSPSRASGRTTVQAHRSMEESSDAEDLRQLRLNLARLDRLLRAAARGDAVGRQAIVEQALAAEKALAGAREIGARRPDLASRLKLAEYERLTRPLTSTSRPVTKKERAVARQHASGQESKAREGPAKTGGIASTKSQGERETARKRRLKMRRDLEAIGGQWVKFDGVAHRRIQRKRLTFCGRPAPERMKSQMEATRICAECRSLSEASRWTQGRGSGWIRPVSGGAPGLGKRS